MSKLLLVLFGLVAVIYHVNATGHSRQHHNSRFLKRSQKQQLQPSLIYGVPQQENKFPSPEFGTPQNNETTDEPDAELLPSSTATQTTQNVAATKPVVAPGAYFVQLADGSYQRVVYYNNVEAAKIQVQPFVQSTPIYYNSLFAPRVVSYSSQYQSW